MITGWIERDGEGNRERIREGGGEEQAEIGNYEHLNRENRVTMSFCRDFVTHFTVNSPRTKVTSVTR
jgi:hypothetical protein